MELKFPPFLILGLGLSGIPRGKVANAAINNRLWLPFNELCGPNRLRCHRSYSPGAPSGDNTDCGR